MCHIGLVHSSHEVGMWKVMEINSCPLCSMVEGCKKMIRF